MKNGHLIMKNDEKIHIACMRFRRGRPVKASRYALRASRSVVVCRGEAASESKKTPPVAVRKTMPH